MEVDQDEPRQEMRNPEQAIVRRVLRAVDVFSNTVARDIREDDQEFIAPWNAPRVVDLYPQRGRFFGYDDLSAIIYHKDNWLTKLITIRHPEVITDLDKFRLYTSLLLFCRAQDDAWIQFCAAFQVMAGRVTHRPGIVEEVHAWPAALQLFDIEGLTFEQYAGEDQVQVDQENFYEFLNSDRPGGLLTRMRDNAHTVDGLLRCFALTAYCGGSVTERRIEKVFRECGDFPIPTVEHILTIHDLTFAHVRDARFYCQMAHAVEIPGFFPIQLQNVYLQAQYTRMTAINIMMLAHNAYQYAPWALLHCQFSGESTNMMNALKLISRYGIVGPFIGYGQEVEQVKVTLYPHIAFACAAIFAGDTWRHYAGNWLANSPIIQRNNVYKWIYITRKVLGTQAFKICDADRGAKAVMSCMAIVQKAMPGDMTLSLDEYVDRHFATAAAREEIRVGLLTAGAEFDRRN